MKWVSSGDPQEVKQNTAVPLVTGHDFVGIWHPFQDVSQPLTTEMAFCPVI